jgi:hypothetical protein
MKSVHDRQSWSVPRFKPIGTVLSLLITLSISFGCGGRQAPALPTPAGAASGVNTFMFFYTDN